APFVGSAFARVFLFVVLEEILLRASPDFVDAMFMRLFVAVAALRTATRASTFPCPRLPQESILNPRSTMRAGRRASSDRRGGGTGRALKNPLIFRQGRRPSPVLS